MEFLGVPLTAYNNYFLAKFYGPEVSSEVGGIRYSGIERRKQQIRTPIC
jgi:hypothetical protein